MEPERTPLPGIWQQKCSLLQRLLLVRFLRSAKRPDFHVCCALVLRLVQHMPDSNFCSGQQLTTSIIADKPLLLINNVWSSRFQFRHHYHLSGSTGRCWPDSLTSHALVQFLSGHVKVRTGRHAVTSP